MIKAIVACDNNWAIGKDNDLLFHLPNDMRAFKAATLNKVVVCGLNTLLSFPGSKPLKGRSTICICPDNVERDDCYCIHDFDTLVRLVQELAKTQDVYIIGGSMLYFSMEKYYDEVQVTKVRADGHGTVFFPNLDNNPDFELSYCSEDIEDNGYLTNICTYRRISNG